MKGYLSRIASQSGLRFSSKGAVAPRREKEPQAGLGPEPLEREETVNVPPPAESNRSTAGALKRGRTSGRHAPENVALKPDRKKAMAKSGPEPVLAPAAPEMTASPVGGETILVTPEPESSPQKQVISSNQSPASTAAGSAPAELVESVMVEPAALTDQHQKQASNPSRAVSSEPEASKKQPEKRYFTKTAEIIGGRVDDPVEVQTILLREVQEWAAAGAASEAAEGAAADKSVESVAISSQAIETKEVVRIPEPEAGVVRIGEKRLAASVPQEASRIDEQRFDLSIGTISVVIEGDERPPQPAPAPRADNRQNGHDTGRRPLRLGRNYL
jgi:hypothetical protein